MKKRNSLFLHIGTHKTGSSALQSVMLKMNNGLRQEGICYLGCPKYFDKILSSTTENTKPLIAESDEIVSNTVSELKSKIRRENIFGRKKFIVSSEKFSGDIYRGYRDADTIAKIWKKITSQLDIDVRIVVYLRRQDDFIQSLYTQLIHQGEYLSFYEFQKRFNIECFNWHLLLNHYENSFSKEQLIVRRYTKDALPSKSSLFFDFGSIVDSKILVLYDENKLKNSGYSRDALEIAKTLNHELSTAERRTMRKLLQKISSKSLHEEYDYFEKGERLKVFKRYIKSNQMVARKYFNEQVLFIEPDTSKMAADYEGLTVDRLLNIYKKTIEEVEKINSNVGENQKDSVKQRLRKALKRKSPTLNRYINLLKGQYN